MGGSPCTPFAGALCSRRVAQNPVYDSPELRSGLAFRIMRNLLRLLKHGAILHHKIDFFQRIHVGQRIA
jgi:hypothetical protein